MESFSRQRPSDKELVAGLIEKWHKRSGLTWKQVAQQTASSYDEINNGFRRLDRNLVPDFNLAIKLVQTYTKHCTVTEVIELFRLIGMPLKNYDRVRDLNLFARHEWDAAVRSAFGQSLAPAPPPPPSAPPAPAPNLLADALERLAKLPTAADAPVPALAALPQPFRMLLDRNRLFEGRAEDLRQIARLLEEQRAEVNIPTVAVTGMGGIGKTNLASEFVFRYGQFFAGGVFWINCSDPAGIADQVAACAAELFPQHTWGESEREGQVRLVRQAWQEPIPRLLVFDDCDREETLKEWRPRSGGCHVLITCRRSTWPRRWNVAPIALGHLRRDESVALLSRYRPELAGSPALAELAAELGDHPLALHLAGSYLEINRLLPLGRDPTRLLRDLQSADLLGHVALRGIDVEDSPTDHDLHIERTLALSLQRLDSNEPVGALARALLRQAAELAPNMPFPRALLQPRQALERDGQETDELTVRALELLTAYGLLTEAGAMVVIHPLVAAFGRRILGDEDAGAEIELKLSILTDVSYQRREIQPLRALLPHLRRRVDQAADRSDEPAIRMFNALPFLMEIAGDIPGGLASLQRAHAALIRQGLEETLLAGEVLNNLAEWHRSVRELALAHSFHDQALALRRRLLPLGDPAIAESCNNYGELLRDQRDYAGARVYLEEAIAIWTAAYGPTHHLVLGARNNLALALRDQGNVAEAAEQFALVLSVALEELGPDDPRTARTQHNLGTALIGQGLLDRAEEQIETAIATMATALGPDHQDTLFVRLARSRLALARDNRPQAQALAAGLLADCIRALGPDDPVTRMVQQWMNDQGFATN